MIIIKEHPFTGISSVQDIDVTPEQIAAWEGGMLIQNAMPNLTPAEREFIKTGLLDEDF